MWWADPVRQAHEGLAQGAEAQRWATEFAAARVATARELGISWADVGRNFGISPEGARKRWGAAAG